MIAIPHSPPCLPLNVYTNSCSDELQINEGNRPQFPESKIRAKSSKQFCDACNSSCCLMNGERKLQARYEGFLLLKRLHRSPTSSKYLMTCGIPEPSRNRPVSHSNSTSSVKHQHIPRERSHSSGDLEGNAIDEVLGIPSSCPTRSISQIVPNDGTWEKLVNVQQNKGGQINVSSTAINSILKPRRQSRSSKGYHRISRTKSRSQDNLMGRRVIPYPAETAENPVENILNNRVQPTTDLLKHSLSRSEGSIHNVTTNGIRDPSPGGGLGLGGIRAEVEELARFPKKILEKVSDEVGQIAFLLERWREEYVVLTHTSIAIKCSNGELEAIVPYSQIVDVQPVAPVGLSGHQFCLLVLCRKTSILMQASTSYVRDQWLHTLIWKRNSHKYCNLLQTAKRPEILLKELKNLVDMSLSTPLHDHSVCQVPLEVASSILINGEDWMSRHTNEEIIVTLAPLLENNRPSAEICSFFSRHCSDNPRSSLVIDMFTPVVRRILKHNVDFCKYPYVRRFVQDYIQSLNSQNDGQNVVHKFVRDIHGNASCCPHLRVLPNLVAVCTSAICSILESQRRQLKSVNFYDERETDLHLICYVTALGVICEYDDWRPGLAQLLQPVPFPDYAFADELFVREMLPVIERIGTDPRCLVHQTMLAPREGKEGWIQLISPSNSPVADKGESWIAIIQVLLSCCYKRKKFLKILLKSLGSCQLLALRDNSTAQDILCLMLEWQLIEDDNQMMQVVSTLQSTNSGKKKYQMLFDRQLHLHEMQQKCGPWKLTLPTKSTDGDVIRLLSSGPFGNLEVLSLAFTRVTSACAEKLIHLSSLKYLDLWGTQFCDKGLQQICEHLNDLQVLNLCETPVTDSGISAITGLKNLQKLNLNSTRISLQMFEQLKEALPRLEEIDVRYTDAW